MKRVLPAIVAASALMLVGCQQEAAEFDPPKERAAATSDKPAPAAALNPSQRASERLELGPLPAFFDCVRESDGMLIASHRGGPAPGYPENAIETMQYGTDLGIVIHEIDVAESQDGVLFLMHDRSLGRTTTGGGAVAETDWDVIQTLNLKDNDGKITAFTPPKLTDVLLWAKEKGVVVELDKKPTTSFRNIISLVRAAGAEQNVILITYNDNQATEVARLAPDLMMTAGLNSRDHQEELEAAGVDFTKVIAWMGTRNPNPRAFAAIGNRGVETAFGTLGRPAERLDTEYWADGNPSEYIDLAEGGLTMLATDEAYRVAEALDTDERALAACANR